MLLAAAVRLYQFDSSALWSDELFTRLYPKLGLEYMWTEGILREPTSPLYYSIIWLVEQVGGDTAFWLRVPSVVASLSCVLLTWALAWELYGRRSSALMATGLIAIAPEMVFYAQEARTYAFQCAAITLALLGFARFLRDRDRIKPLAAYTIGATLAIYLHPTSLIAVGAMNVAALVGMYWLRRQTPVVGARRWIGANAIVAATCMPLVPGLLSADVANAVAWIPRLDRWCLEQALGRLLAGAQTTSFSMHVTEVGLPLLAALLLVSRWRPSARVTVVILLTPALFFAGMIAVSVSKPILLDRTILWLWVPLAVVLGDVLMERAKLASIAVVACLLAGLVLQQQKLLYLKENWRFLDSLPPLPPSTLVVLGAHTSPAAVELYGSPHLVATARVEEGDKDVAETIVSDRAFHLTKISSTALRSAIASGRPVCLIFRSAERLWVREALADVAAPSIVMQDRAGNAPGALAAIWQ